LYKHKLRVTTHDEYSLLLINFTW